MFNIREKFFLFKNKIKKNISFLLSFFHKKDKKYIQSQEELDIELVRSLSQSKIPSLKQLKYIGKVLSKKEKNVMKVLFGVILVNLVFLGYNFYYKNLKLIPKSGGEYTEGVVDALQYINPLYASNNSIDNDIGSLIFSSLFYFNGNGKLSKDLVTNYTISKDKKRYNISIRTDAKWSNGDNLTVDDIVFTFKMIKNPDYNSVISYKFNNVKIEKTGAHTVSFILKSKKNNFLDTLTFGILPKKIWSQIPPETVKLADLNLKPIGSGKYKFNELIKDKMGNIVLYQLVKNPDYYGKKPYIDKIIFKFFVNETELISALNNNKIDGAAVDSNAQDSIAGINALNVKKIALSQVGAVFFNQNNVNLKNKDIRQALSMSLDKYGVVDSSFGEDAQVDQSPLVPYHKSYQRCITGVDKCIVKYKFDPWQGKKILNDLGWEITSINQDEIDKIENKRTEIELQKQKNATSTDNNSKKQLSKAEKIKLNLGAGKWMVKFATSTDGIRDISESLILNLSIVNRPKYLKMASSIKDYWRKIGVKVNINIVPVSEIQNKIIENKDFDCLLWTYDLGHNFNLYPFWHKDEILNLAQYDNEEVNKILEKLNKENIDRSNDIDDYDKLQRLITGDIPAIFLYSPYYVYLQSKKIKNFNLDHMSDSSERFVNISDWYIKTERKLVF